MSHLNKVLYTAKTHTTGGRDGASRTDDGRLDIKLSSPTNTSEAGTNPEQLFAAGWSACFLSAIKVVAGKKKITLPPDAAIDAEVDLGTADGTLDLRLASTSACRAWSTRRRKPWRGGAPGVPLFPRHAGQRRGRAQRGERRRTEESELKKVPCFV